ncbi:MAG: hypothetical protein GY696_31370, partial [Gammaproteobacteria bacterium]|nr:hypothetical protein [Gammaproteobacteria bacterium]
FIPRSPRICRLIIGPPRFGQQPAAEYGSIWSSNADAAVCINANDAVRFYDQQPNGVCQHRKCQWASRPRFTISIRRKCGSEIAEN